MNQTEWMCKRRGVLRETERMGNDFAHCQNVISRLQQHVEPQMSTQSVGSTPLPIRRVSPSNTTTHSHSAALYYLKCALQLENGFPFKE